VGKTFLLGEAPRGRKVLTIFVSGRGAIREEEDAWDLFWRKESVRKGELFSSRKKKEGSRSYTRITIFSRRENLKKKKSLMYKKR